MAMTKEEKKEILPIKMQAPSMAEEDPMDARLETAVEEAVKEKSSQVHAVAKDGLVTLFGFAPDTKAKRDIASITRSMPGVRGVTNHIKVMSEQA